MAKIQLARMTGDGEQVNIEFNLPNSIVNENNPEKKQAKIEAFLAPYFGAMESRMVALNKRVLAAMKFAQGLTPEQQWAVQATMDMSHGRQPQPREGIQQPVPGDAVASDKAAIAAEIDKLAGEGKEIKEGVVIDMNTKKPLEQGGTIPGGEV